MNNILEVKNIYKNYADHQALKDVSISVPAQSIFGLLGPNGAGKTSLIRIITQIISKDQGTVTFDGQVLEPQHVRNMGYLPEERGLYKKMKVGEQLLYLAQLKGLPRKEALSRIKLWFEKFEMKPWWKKNVMDLSKGMQQKVQFVATVLHQPKLIILDEPFSGFDPVNANLIKDEILKLREQGSTIIFSTHRMESVEELCDHIALINKSQKVLEGKTKEVKDTYKTNTYLVDYEGQLNGDLSEHFKIKETTSLGEHLQRTAIQLDSNTVSPNDLLAQLITQVSVQAFQERIPSINDIFIKLVSGE
ncbi:ABC transporter ATP-binding protein [Microscilla marina]|uniref:ABC transporter, ATP-binding protein n=1 Tax=Microscilla marina ATCC 23134 TaxID=313606 RepID=A1ZI26_MICM2|nr:ATP-binding cassette domain-containing protein [Microscilla marina]EAY29694.1 ABC transporter, ATP-binding protein [Microscilla marina ATCC 23134]